MAERSAPRWRLRGKGTGGSAISCESRAVLLTRLGLRRAQSGSLARRSTLSRLVPAAAFGLGVLLTFVVMSRLAPVPGASPTGPASEGGAADHGPTLAPAVISPDEQIRHLMQLPPSQFKPALDALGALHPDLQVQISLALGAYYMQAAEMEKDPVKKQSLLKQGESAYMDARRELNRKITAVHQSMSVLPDHAPGKSPDTPAPGKQ